MSQTMSSEDFEAVSRMSADARFDHLVGEVLTNETVWTLRSEKGLVIMSSEGEQCLPVWPHPDFAAAWATGDWADCEPFEVDLSAWVERWLPGMKEDGLSLAVFPVGDAETPVVEPEEMKAAIQSRQQL